MGNKHRDYMIDKVQRLIRERPVDIARAFGFTKLHEIDENGYSLHNEWMKMMLFAKKDLLLQAHRLSYKTTCVIAVLAISLIAFPKMTFAFFRKTDSDIKEVMNAVRKCLATDTAKWLAVSLWNTDLKMVKESTEELTTSIFLETRGSAQLTGMGIGSSLVGKHYDKIFTDDICTIKDRTSRAEREATKTAYGELGNVINDISEDNPFVGVTINTGTPWHRDDVYQKMPDPFIWDYTVTGILSDEKIEKQRKKLTKSEFAANYELKHVSNDGQIFQDPKYTVDKARLYYGYAHIDCAFGGENFTALTIMNDDKSSGNYYGFGIVWQQHVQKCYGEIKKLIKEFRVDATFLEDNADKGYVEQELGTIGIFTKGYHEQQNKHVKISTWLYDAWDKIFWLKETDPEYINQILDYMEDIEPDDAPDSCASLIREVEARQEAFII